MFAWSDPFLTFSSFAFDVDAFDRNSVDCNAFDVMPLFTLLPLMSFFFSAEYIGVKIKFGVSVECECKLMLW